jgi:hypothetical protein
MVNIYQEAKEIGYNASRFIQLVNDAGALSAAKQLINAGQASDGFTKLWELRRLDIAVEARALKPEFQPLFTQAELTTCSRRLDDYKWTQQPPWQRPT